MKRAAVLAGLTLAFGLGVSAANAAIVTLTFEGLANQETIGNYYDGGYGGSGSGPGPDYGITFGPDSLALISNQAGGNGNFSNAPSGDTVAFFESGPGDVMDVAAGFDTGFSFYYAAALAGSVSVFSGLDGTGTELASLSLAATADPYTVFDPIGVAFSGTAESVVFSGSANYIGFDNVTLGAATPMGAAPEPSTWLLMMTGVGAIGYGFRYAKKTRGSTLAAATAA